MNKCIQMFAAAATVATAFAALASSAYAATPKESNGTFVDENGMTLYAFDKDKAGSPSACTAGCAKAWPAAMAGASDQPSGKWTMEAADGGKQWAYDGKRAYRFSKDTKPGEKNGDNFHDVWHAVKP